MCNGAISNGLPQENRAKLLEDVKKRDMWRLKLGRDPPAKVTPMKLLLQPDAIPFRAKTLRYAERHREFMHDHVSSMEKNDFVFRNPNSKCASAYLVVDKKDVEVRGHRMTIDTWEVNKQTIRIAWPMPHIDLVLSYLRSATIFILFDV